MFDRRNDVGAKMFYAIISAILTTFFVGGLTLSVRNYEIANKHDTRIALLEQCVINQNKLNEKFDRFLESKVDWGTGRLAFKKPVIEH